MPIKKPVKSSQPPWKEWDDKAQKSGEHSTVYSTNGDQYTGQWSDNQKNGKGRQFWKKSGGVYDGDWVEGKRCGYGTYSLPTDDGTYRRVYEGGWLNDQKHGNGTYFYSATNFYEGEWCANERQGWGRMYYEDGSVYEGRWDNDMRNGHGMLRLANENRYEGEWKYDKKHGEGKYYYLDKGHKYVGTWVDDIAKCGEMTDFNRDEAKEAIEFPIPKDSMAVVKKIAGSAFLPQRKKISDYVNSLIQPQLNRGESCEFTSITSMCIDKASTSLRGLEGVCEEWRLRLIEHNLALKESSEKLRQDFSHQLKANPAARKKLEAITSGSILKITKQGGRKKIEVTGVQIPSFPDKSEIVSKIAPTIDGIAKLLDRVESDRASASYKLEQEKEKTAKQREDIDNFCYERIHRLPLVVQREHEKCAYDVLELKWHCEYQERIEMRVKERLRVASKINKNIHEQLDFIKENSPLIEDKIVHEGESMQLIGVEQHKVDGKLGGATSEMDSTHHTFSNMKQKATDEQSKLAQEVSKLNNELDRKQLTHMARQSNYNELCEREKALKITYEQYLKDSQLMDDRQKELMLQISELEDLLADVTNKVEGQVYDKLRLGGEHTVLIKRQELVTEKIYEEDERLSTLIEEKTQQLKDFVLNNRKMEKETADLLKEIAQCEKQKEQDENAVKRALIEREKVAVDLDVIKEENSKFRLTHQSLLMNVDVLCRNAEELENSLCAQRDAMLKSCKEENKSRVILQAKIDVETLRFRAERKIFERRRKKFEQDLEVVTEANSILSEQIRDLEEKLKARHKVSADLDRLTKFVAEKRETDEKSYNYEIAVLEPKESDLISNLNALLKKDNDREASTVDLRKKVSNITESSLTFANMLKNTEIIIRELNKDIKELDTRIKTDTRISETLWRDFNELKGRSASKASEHELTMEKRKQAYSEYSGALEDQLNKNAELAHRFLKLQTSHVNTRHAFLSAYERFTICEDQLTDQANLCALHTKLHQALNCYYNLRGLQTKDGLSRFAAMAQQSRQKLLRIHDALQDATTVKIAPSAIGKVGVTWKKNKEPWTSIKKGLLAPDEPSIKEATLMQTVSS